MTSLYAPASDDVKQRLRPFGIFFEKSLKDLIKGIRSNNETPEKLQHFLAQALSECREEANSPDLNMKTNAVLKLTYLEMYGFDMSWANFHILEVMSSNKLQQKRVGYLAASQSFYKDSDILMLATNLMKKDLKYGGNNDVVKVGIALSGLSTIVTPSLAADICDDLFGMLSSSKPYIRKKAVTALFKVFLQYPEALRDNFEKFAAKLEDDDTSVLSAMVSVICELSKKNPQPFIKLSPMLYEILVNISNNWIIIRLLKLFTNLSKVEPKLRPKLLPKIMELMDSTVATSVLYESINCIVKGNMLSEDDFDTAVSCLDRLHTFCDSSDPNLRYISCVLFYKIGKINIAFISQFDKLVLRLLNDVDISIRSKALELVVGVVSEENLKSVVMVLLKQFVDEDTIVIQTGDSTLEVRNEIPIVISEPYKIKMVNTIINICCTDNFGNLTDFEWYNTVLRDLTMLSQDISDPSLGRKIGEQLRNSMVRVPSMRENTMSTIIRILSTDSVYTQTPSVLKECLWSLGEYSSLVDNGDDLIESILARKHHYSAEIQQVSITALLKIFTSWFNGHPDLDRSRLKFIMKELLDFYQGLSYSKDFEVQERAVESSEILKLSSEALQEDTDGLPLLMSEVMPSLFNSHELKPLSQGVQKQLQQNVTVDCETPFLSAEELTEILEKDVNSEAGVFTDDSLGSEAAKYAYDEEEVDDSSSYEKQFSNDLDISKEEKEALEKRKEEERQSNPFYLAREETTNKGTNGDLLDLSDNASHGEQSSNVIRLSKQPTDQPTLVDETKKDKKKKKKTKRRIEVLPDEVVAPTQNAAASKPSDVRTTPSSQSISSLAPSSKKISLKTHTMLENFDFSRPKEDLNDTSVVVGSDRYAEQDEIDKLRAKFAKQGLVEAQPADNDEEVVIVKKKRSSKKKRRNPSKAESKPQGEENGANS